MSMNNRRTMGLVGAAVATAGAGGIWQILGAQAQDSSGGEIDLGGSIADTVTGAVSSIATNSSSGGTVTGGTQVEHNEVSLGEKEGLAISDASGGNNNVSFVS